MRSIAITLASVLLAAAAALTGAAQAGGPAYFLPTADQKIQLLKGEVITEYDYDSEDDGPDRGHALAVISVNADADYVMEVLLETETYDEYLPGMEASTELTRGEKRIDTRHEIDAIITTLDYVLIQHPDPKRGIIDYKLDKSKPSGRLSSLDGYWRIIPVTSETHFLVYAFDLQIDIPILSVIVSPIIAAMARETLPDIMQSMKRRIESRKSWKKTAQSD